MARRLRYRVHYGQNDGAGYVVTDSAAVGSEKDWRGKVVFRTNSRSDAFAEAQRLNDEDSDEVEAPASTGT
jgi:hypothetical protein